MGIRRDEPVEEGGGPSFESGLGVQKGARATFFLPLKAMSAQVKQQMKDDGLAKRFALGDDKVNLSDVMIDRQKTSLSLRQEGQGQAGECV